MDIQMLIKTAQSLVDSGKGILAADESSPTIKKRFDTIGVESNEENRRNYRELLFRTQGISEYISGVILYDETIKQQASDGSSLIEVLVSQGIIPGIKVDLGGKDLAGFPGEKITEGLDGLRERLFEYKSQGARFTKWRALINIGQNIPSKYCILANAHGLSRFAALSQEVGLVPIVEPEILMDGTHSAQTCYEITEETLREVFYQLNLQRVSLEGMLLKPNMILSGKSALSRVGPEEVAQLTISCFKKVIPPAVPGIVFLSGGQSDTEATINLDAINKMAAKVMAPWQLSFSYGRGLQATPLKIWRGKRENVGDAQASFYQRARMTSEARQGLYSA